jgi:hypothetical protein
VVDSNNFKAQLKAKDEEAHQAKKDYETQLATNAENAQRALKAKDEAHAVAMGGLLGELYSKYEEERLKALDEVSAARGKVEEEKSKLETDLQELVVSKVI